MATLCQSTAQFEPLMRSEAAQQPLLAQALDLVRAALQLAVATDIPLSSHCASTVALN